VEPAHMELAEPSIGEAIGRCVEAGCKVVVVAPLFLFRGRHVESDIPALVGEAASHHSGVRCLIAPPLGTSPLPSPPGRPLPHRPPLGTPSPLGACPLWVPHPSGYPSPPGFPPQRHPLHRRSPSGYLPYPLPPGVRCLIAPPLAISPLPSPRASPLISTGLGPPSPHVPHRVKLWHPVS
jgi:CbiX